MKALHSTLCFLALAALVAIPSLHAEQTASGLEEIGNIPHYTDSRTYNENPDMGWNKGLTWAELMESYYYEPTVEDRFRAIAKVQKYRLTRLDGQLSSQAIAWERLKQSVAEEVLDLISAEANTAKNVSKKIYGKSAGISYELLPNRTDIRAILPSLISVEKTKENHRKGVLKLRGKARVVLAEIVPMIPVIQGEPFARMEVDDVRRMAAEAMDEITQLQKLAAGSTDTSVLEQRYSNAVNRLMAADRIERGRYFALWGKTQEALDAYTEAIQALPGLGIAYRSRGGIHLYLNKHAEAMADFLNAYTSDAIDNTEAKNFQACVDDTEAALRLFENYPTAYYHRAVCRLGLNQKSLAAADLRKAAQLGEKRAQEALNRLGPTLE